MTYVSCFKYIGLAIIEFSSAAILLEKLVKINTFSSSKFNLDAIGLNICVEYSL